MRILRSSIILFTLALMHSVSYAQWQGGGTKIFDGNGRFGCLTYKDGITWAGKDALWKSLDSGITWQQVPIPLHTGEFISKIDFHDDHLGVLSTDQGKIIITHDQGQSWQIILTTSSFTKGFWSCAMGLDSDNIVAPTNDAGIIYTTLDGGRNWHTSSSGTCHDIKCLDSMTFVRLENGRLSKSTDKGITWKQLPQDRGWGIDTYSFEYEQCNPIIYYVANEAIGGGEGISNLFASLDGGTTWTVPLSMFTAGAGVQATSNAAYLQSTDGLLRSSNHGRSWSSLGGPRVIIDSRQLFVLNDSLILEGGDGGYLWRTRNAGSIPLTLSSQADEVAMTPDHLFDSDSISSCSTVLRHLVLTYTECRRKSRVSRATIQSGDSSSFRIVSYPSSLLGGKDTITLSFTPAGIHTYKSELLLTFEDGSTLSYPLVALVRRPKVFPSAVGVGFGNLIQICNSMPRVRGIGLMLDSCIDIVDQQIVGPDANSFRLTTKATHWHGVFGYDSVALVTTKIGPHFAYLQITRNDGVIDSLTMGGVASEVIWYPTFHDVILDSTECEARPSYGLTLSGKYCDSVKVLSVELDSKPKGVLGWDSSVNRYLLGYDTLRIFSAAPDSSVTAHVRMVLADSTIWYGDIAIPPGSRSPLTTQSTITASTFACETFDTTLVLCNHNKIPLRVNSVWTDNPHFEILNPTLLNTSLAPGACETVRLRLHPDTTNAKPVMYGTLWVNSSGCPALQSISLQATIDYPTNWVVSTSMLDSAYAGDQVDCKIMQSLPLDHDISRLDMSIAFDDTVLKYTGMNPPLYFDSANVSRDSLEHIYFHINPPSATAYLGTIKFTPILAAKYSSPVILSDASFQSDQHRTQDCIATPEYRNSNFSRRARCDDSLLLRFMSSGSIQIVSVRPNPAVDDLVVRVSAETESDTEVSLMDLFGRVILRQPLRIPAKSSVDVNLDLRSVPAGAYFVSLKTCNTVLYRAAIKD